MSDALLQAGANVAVWSLSRESIDTFLSGYQDVPELCDRVHGIQVATCDERAVADAFDQSAARFDVPRILINGVGGNRSKSPFIEGKRGRPLVFKFINECKEEMLFSYSYSLDWNQKQKILLSFMKSGIFGFRRNISYTFCW